MAKEHSMFRNVSRSRDVGRGGRVVGSSGEQFPDQENTCRPSSALRGVNFELCFHCCATFRLLQTAALSGVS